MEEPQNLWPRIARMGANEKQGWWSLRNPAGCMKTKDFGKNALDQ
jgi:hypothetical protein